MKSIILLQRELRIIDGKKSLSRWELAENHEWCCEGLKDCPEIFFTEDGKFGFPIYDYHCGDSWFKGTEEINYCPYCGKEIEVIHLDPLVKKGQTQTVIDEKGWKQKYIEWEDGTFEKSGCRFKSFKLDL